MAPDSGFCRGTGRDHSGDKGNPVGIRWRNAIPKLVAYMGCIAVYLILLAVTRLLFKRPVTTELFLIIGWAMLALSEINILYGVGRFSYRLAVIFTIVIGVAALISLVCYVLYYNLGNYAGYFDGMVPLLMAALVMAGISVAMVV